MSCFFSTTMCSGLKSKCTGVHFDFNHEHIVVEKKQDSADRFQIKCYF